MPVPIVVVVLRCADGGENAVGLASREPGAPSAVDCLPNGLGHEVHLVCKEHQASIREPATPTRGSRSSIL
jgi:hypothetical protein